jgi:hypothetical protein
MLGGFIVHGQGVELLIHWTNFVFQLPYALVTEDDPLPNNGAREQHDDVLRGS